MSGRTLALFLIAGVLLSCCSELDMINNHLREIAAAAAHR